MEAQESQDIALPACVLEQRSITPSEQAVAMTDTDTYIDRAERAEAERNELKRNLDAELEGAMALRERCGARKNESFPAFVERLHRDRDSLRALLREARESWIKVGYGASHEDVAECRDFCSRIDAALGEGK